MTLLTRTVLLLLLLLGAAADTLANERILNYFSDIQVRQDGSLLVEEHIEVQAEGKQIKRGIFRDFPTDYKDRLGNRYKVDFKLLEVRRDGRSEPHHTERQGNGIRIYIGSKNVFLKPGIYTYTLRYTTNRQLGFFDQHDELYWNVTGNAWAFPIDQAGARVVLPDSVPSDAIHLEAYTGAQGARGQQYTARLNDYGEPLFQTTAPLPRHHGLTIVATWPKGYVTEPTDEQRMQWFLDDNRSLVVGGGGLLLLLLYFTVVWHRVGRDPDIGVVVPHYTPPKGYSPASMRFIRRMGYDNQAFGAAIVNMAVEGYLKIKESSSGIFTLEKTGATPKLAPGESAIASALFGEGRQSIDLKRKNHKRLGKAIKAHKGALERDYEKTYFVTNSGFVIPGVLITLGLLGGTLLATGTEDQLIIGGFMTIWLTFWSLGVFKMAYGIYQLLRNASGAMDYLKAVFGSLFALPFFAGEAFGLFMLTEGVSLSYTLTLVIATAINVLFYEWLKAPTLAGQQLLQKVEGFRNYLALAEAEELNYKHPVEKTPELFETYLPYALALEVEQQWAERFSDVLASAGQGDDNYRPSWYSGRSWNSRNLTGFSSAMGSAMGSAIASSSTAPGSSSGSGGGGSSGGGGGGGGGGGW